MGGLAAAVVLLFFISVRALDRPHCATKHTSSNPLQQFELKWTEKGENSTGFDGLPVTEEKSRLFRSQLPLEPGASSLDSLATLSTPGLLGIQTDSFTARASRGKRLLRGWSPEDRPAIPRFHRTSDRVHHLALDRSERLRYRALFAGSHPRSPQRLLRRLECRYH